tara:strand:+ start:73 stop:567 length:495 start_codon:yes stop_codon:yes gene_type:complete
MTRGKNKEISQRRNTALQEIGSLELLKHRVHKLENEVKALNVKAKETKDTNRATVARLLENLKIGTSDRVQELEVLLDELKMDLGRANKTLAQKHSALKNVSTKFIVHLIEAHGLTYTEALTSIMKGIKGEETVLLDSDLIAKLKSGKLPSLQEAIILQSKRQS